MSYIWGQKSGDMAKIKKTNSYNIEETANSQFVNEPSAIYTTSTSAGRTIGMMGMSGKKEFESIRNENDFISVIRNGIPKQAMTYLMTVAGLSLVEMASITHTSDRTLRRYKPQEKLSQEQSERMIELARLYSRGEQVFGSIASFRQWMDTSLLPFGNKKPKDFLDTSIGISMILNELGRIENGIFA